MDEESLCVSLKQKATMLPRNKTSFPSLKDLLPEDDDQLPPLEGEDLDFFESLLRDYALSFVKHSRQTKLPDWLQVYHDELVQSEIWPQGEDPEDLFLPNKRLRGAAAPAEEIYVPEEATRDFLLEL